MIGERVLEQRIRSGELHPVLESHLAKYRSLIPSLALLLGIGEGESKGEPSAWHSLEKAIAWGRYLESHANRTYGSITMTEVQSAKMLAKKIRDGALEDGFALRDVYRRGWAGLRDKAAAQEAIDLLCDLDWLAAEETRPAAAQKWNTSSTQKSQKHRGDALTKLTKAPFVQVLTPFVSFVSAFPPTI